MVFSFFFSNWMVNLLSPPFFTQDYNQIAVKKAKEIPSGTSGSDGPSEAASVIGGIFLTSAADAFQSATYILFEFFVICFAFVICLVEKKGRVCLFFLDTRRSSLFISGGAGLIIVLALFVFGVGLVAPWSRLKGLLLHAVMITISP